MEEKSYLLNHYRRPGYDLPITINMHKDAVIRRFESKSSTDENGQVLTHVVKVYCDIGSLTDPTEIRQFYIVSPTDGYPPKELKSVEVGEYRIDKTLFKVFEKQ